jgi:hypothetical protein
VCVGLGCVRVHREIVVPAQTGSGGSITEEGGRAYHRLLAQEELCTRRAEEKGETSPPLSCNFLFLQLSFGGVGKELIDEVDVNVFARGSRIWTGFADVLPRGSFAARRVHTAKEVSPQSLCKPNESWQGCCA